MKQLIQINKEDKVFRVDVSTNDLWNLYLSSFKDEGIFRDPNSSIHNCNLCRSFINRYGNVAVLTETGRLKSIFNIELEQEDELYAPFKALTELVESSKIKSVFFEHYSEIKLNNTSNTASSFLLGTPKNHKQYNKEEALKFGVVQENEIRTFHHLHLSVPKEFILTGAESVASRQGVLQGNFDVLYRGLKEISLDTLTLVRDLISQGSLLNGSSYLPKLNEFIKLKETFDGTETYAWKHVESPFARFRNELIGTLCVELTEGLDLNKACLNWNKRADPANYMKATAPITQRQIEEAKKFVEASGYAESFDRRYATIDDVKAEEILFLNSGSGKLESVSIFDGLKPIASQHKRAEFSGVEEIDIEKFMKEVLPYATGLEAYFENKHQNNLCTLTKAVSDKKNIFKYDNNYSKTFKGNLAGNSTLIKQSVSTMGGKIDGVLRFSIMWSEGDNDGSDLDAHCIEPDGNRIYYANRNSLRTQGNLDVDITQPLSDSQVNREKVSGAVENITYPDKNRMIVGEYNFSVNPFSARNSKGFKAEIEVDGIVYCYNFDKRVDKQTRVATIKLDDKGLFTITSHLPEAQQSSKSIWGVETLNFHKVSLVCLSPNHWGNNAIGNKHYMFMLDKCKVDEPIRTFHNEDLTPELLTHRKVMETLGNSLLLQPTGEKQLSGLGFNASVRDELVVKVSGSHKRMLKIKF